jgi:hypothetical protein
MQTTHCSQGVEAVTLLLMHVTLPYACRQYGITHTLDQLFDAPPLVKHMLVDLSGINKCVV